MLMNCNSKDYSSQITYNLYMDLDKFAKKQYPFDQ
ncbi:hypothetical protein ABID42_001990 [Arcicella rosea]